MSGQPIVSAGQAWGLCAAALFLGLAVGFSFGEMEQARAIVQLGSSQAPEPSTSSAAAPAPVVRLEATDLELDRARSPATWAADTELPAKLEELLAKQSASDLLLLAMQRDVERLAVDVVAKRLELEECKAGAVGSEVLALTPEERGRVKVALEAVPVHLQGAEVDWIARHEEELLAGGGIYVERLVEFLGPLRIARELLGDPDGIACVRSALGPDAFARYFDGLLPP